MATYTGTSVGTPSMPTTVPCPAHQIGPFYAGEDLLAGAPCYVKASDGKVYRTNGTAANAAAKCDGWCVKDTESGRPVTLYFNVIISYGSPTAPAVAARLYASATAGSLDDAATTGGTAPIAVALPAPANTTSAMGFLFVKQSAY